MTQGRLAAMLRRTCALALVTVLLCAVPVYAAGETTRTPAPRTSVPAPAPSPSAPSVTEPRASDPAPTRTPPDTEGSSPIQVPVDPETQQFRDELARRQARLDEFTAQLDELDRELALAAEAYNAAVDRLNATQSKVSDTEVDLEKAREAYDFQVDLLNSRANSIYRDGTFATIEVLLDSKSMADFVSRVKFLNTIGLADADVAKQLKGQKELVEQTAQDLKDAEKQAEALEFELKARQIEVLLRIQERQEMLASAQADLLELLDQEASRRRVAEAELLRAVLSGASDAGIVVAPGSPVETALAYHGIPYLWGGETPSGFDCSGLILYVFRQHGVALPHYSGSQFLMGEKIMPSELQPGDVVFFGSPIHHVGMYVGGDHFLHAPRTGDFVKLSRLSARSDYAGARRYDWVPRAGDPVGVSVSPVTPLLSQAR